MTIYKIVIFYYISYMIKKIQMYQDIKHCFENANSIDPFNYTSLIRNVECILEYVWNYVFGTATYDLFRTSLKDVHSDTDFVVSFLCGTDKTQFELRVSLDKDSNYINMGKYHEKFNYADIKDGKIKTRLNGLFPCEYNCYKYAGYCPFNICHDFIANSKFTDLPCENCAESLEKWDWFKK